MASRPIGFGFSGALSALLSSTGAEGALVAAFSNLDLALSTSTTKMPFAFSESIIRCVLTMPFERILSEPVCSSTLLTYIPGCKSSIRTCSNITSPIRP